jgi:hypothetical protein
MFTWSLHSVGTILKGSGRSGNQQGLGARDGARADPTISERIRSPEPVVQGQMAFLAMSEQIWSLEQAPSTRVQGLQKGGRKSGCSHEQVDPITRADHE